MEHFQSSVEAIYSGWYTYQRLLIAALVPLTSQQLALRAAPKLRTIEEIATHMIGARARWFAPPLGDGDKQFTAFARWDHRGGRLRSAEEIVYGLGTTWKGIQAYIAGWSADDWKQTIPGESSDEPQVITRPWIIWHIIEHDLHHGGEISITLGQHGLIAPAL